MPIKLIEILSQQSLIPSFKNIEKNLSIEGMHLEVIRQDPSWILNSEFSVFQKELNTGELSDTKMIRLDLNTSSLLLPKISVLPENVKEDGVCDTLIFDNNSFIPRNFYFESLRRVFVNKFKKSRLNGCAAIICHEYEVDAMISFSVSLGFSHLLVFLEDVDPFKLKGSLKKFIGVQVDFVNSKKITENSHIATIMINSMDLEHNTNLLADVCYFNFMHSDGVIIDLFSKSPISPFLFEAEKANLKTLSRREVAMNYDFFLLEKLNLQDKVSKDSFFSNYIE